MTEPLRRVAAGDYETRDGEYRIVRIVDVSPPAWDLIARPFTRDEEVAVAGCPTLAEARLFLEDERQLTARRRQP